jgi:hypothetical protein
MKRSLLKSRFVLASLLAGFGFIFLGATLPDEGMWTFDNPPLKLLKERYGFEPTPEWLDHVRLSSVRFNDGGSGSFVSPNGLVLTNHHVALGQLQKISSAQKDYVKNGFYATAPAEELKCPDLELNVLRSMEEVTARVQAAGKTGMNDKAALEARKAEIAKIAKESMEATGLRSDVVMLYQGASIGSIVIKNIPTCVWCLRRNNKRLFMAAIPTTSLSRAMTWTWRFSAFMKMTNRWNASII